MQPITQHAPLHGARLKKCAACGQVKPLTAYTARGHKRCSDCIGYTHGRAGANGRLRRPANAPITNATTTELYDGAELRTPVRPGALDAFAWPSRYGSRLVYRDEFNRRMATCILSWRPGDYAVARGENK